MRSGDGNYALALGVRAGFIDSARRTAEVPFEHNLEIRRLRLVLSGNVFRPTIKYFVQLAVAPRELELKDSVPHRGPLLDTFVVFDRFRDANLRIGIDRVMYTRLTTDLVRLQFQLAL